MRERIHTILFYTLLVSVYGIFFSVESFFNFEGQVNARQVFTYSASIQGYGKAPGVARTNPLPSSSHTIRLNKRYHQENISPCTVFSIEAPVAYITPRTLNLYRSEPLPAADITHYPLRGPPVAA